MATDPGQQFYNEMFQYYQNQANAPTNTFNGEYTPILANILQSGIKNGDPNLGTYRMSGEQAINRQTQAAVKQNSQNLAATGMDRSGIGAAANNEVYGNAQAAENQLNTSLAQVNNQYIQQAIGELLGLNQFTGQQELATRNANRNYQLAGQNFLEGQREYNVTSHNQQLAAKQAGWGQLLGTLLSLGSSAAMGGGGGSAGSGGAGAAMAVPA